MVPYFKKRKNRSAIINVTSCLGIYVSHNAGNYSLLKHLIDIYSRTMALENS